MQIPYIFNGNGTISLMIDGSMKPVDSSHRNYEAIKTALKAKEWDIIPGLVNIVDKVQASLESSGVSAITIENGVVKYNGVTLHNVLTDRMVQMSYDGFDIGHLAKFLENLMENPSYRAVNELYGFLEAGSIPITENGTFLAYKKVRENYMDIHSGTFDNSIGVVCKMPRNMVDEDSSRTCSTGLHVCSYDYLDSFGSCNNDRVVICEVNPRDVVAIPQDYNNTKMRCCEYKVIGEVENYREKNKLAAASVIKTTEFRTEPCPVVEATKQNVSIADEAKEFGKAITEALNDTVIDDDDLYDLSRFMSGHDCDNLINAAVEASEDMETKYAGKLIAKAVQIALNNGTPISEFVDWLAEFENESGDL